MHYSCLAILIFLFAKIKIIITFLATKIKTITSEKISLKIKFHLLVLPFSFVNIDFKIQDWHLFLLLT